MAKNKEKRQAQSNQSYDPKVPNMQNKNDPQTQNCKDHSAKN